MRPAELLTFAAYLLGWVAATVGIAALVASSPDVAVWWLSAGLLLMGLGGFRSLALLLWYGLMEASDAATKPASASDESEQPAPRPVPWSAWTGAVTRRKR